MFSGPTLPPNEPTWKSSGPCPSCAAKDTRIAELEGYSVKWFDKVTLLEKKISALEKVAGAAEWFADDHDNAAKRAFEANRSYEATCRCRLCVAIDKLRRLTEGRGEKEGG